MSFRLYKWPQGRVIRYLAGAVGLSYVLFASMCFRDWRSNDTPLFEASTDNLQWLEGVLTVGNIGFVVVLLLGALFIYSMVFASAKVGEYLIGVETEMRKVYWPRIKPWFSWSSELWGSTYVVIIVVVIITVFIYLVDKMLTPIQLLFL
jgi:preprotein translocase subunit SecE